MSSDAQLIAPVASENHSQRSFRGRARPWLGLILEIAIVAVWTLLITRPFLNLEADSVPAGIDYGSSIQSHYVWERFLDCQTCAFWNGDLRGGAPSFADVHGDMLHPIVIIPTLAWGTLTGAKFALVLAFFMGGFAQWWLGYALRLGSIPRVWGGMAAVTAGHLAGRIENGNVGLITSMAASALVIPALIQLVWQPTKRHSAVLGVVATGALLSGQGYYQIGIVLLAPLSLVLLIGR